MLAALNYSKEYEEEEMNPNNRRKHSYRGFVAVLAVFLCLAGIALACYLIRINQIEVVGNQHCSEEQVTQKVFPTEEDKRLGIVLYRMFFGMPIDGAFESCSISLTSLTSCEIHVKESESCVQVHFGNWYVFLNENGIVMGVQTETDSSLPCIEGDLFSGFNEFEAPVTEDQEALMEAINVACLIFDSEIGAPVVYVDNRTYTLEEGEIRIQLGSASYLEAKLREAMAQLPYLSGLHGTLHLETYSPDAANEKYYFTVE